MRCSHWQSACLPAMHQVFHEGRRDGPKRISSKQKRALNRYQTAEQAEEVACVCACVVEEVACLSCSAVALYLTKCYNFILEECGCVYSAPTPCPRCSLYACAHKSSRG